MTRKNWWIVGGVIALVVLIIAVVAIVSSSSEPDDYVEATFTRDTSLDVDANSKAYTSDKPPDEVAAMITGEVDPIATSRDSSGVYLRYDEDGIAIQPRGGGSVIHVMDAEAAGRRYYDHVHSSWGLIILPGGGIGFRGRGPGAGK